MKRGGLGLLQALTISILQEMICIRIKEQLDVPYDIQNQVNNDQALTENDILNRRVSVKGRYFIFTKFSRWIEKIKVKMIEMVEIKRNVN